MKKEYEKPYIEVVSFEADEELMNDIGADLGTSEMPDNFIE